MMRADQTRGIIQRDTSEIIGQMEDGWTVRIPRTIGDLRREGHLMSNCVASYGYADLDDGDLFTMRDRIDIPAKQRSMRLVSLRDEHNMPHASAWLASTRDGSRDLFFCRGLHNSAMKPHRAHTQRLAEWCAGMDIGWHVGEMRNDPSIIMMSQILASFRGEPWQQEEPSSLPGHLVVPKHAHRIDPERDAYNHATSLVVQLGCLMVERPDDVELLTPLHARAERLLDAVHERGPTSTLRAALTHLGHDTVELLDRLDEESARSAALDIAV